MFVKQIRVESLGNSSYIVGSEEEGTCAIVDPVRDIDIYVREAESLGYRILYSLETHVHNDFVSGSRELAAKQGATVYASAAGGLVFEHRPLRPGDRVELGGSIAGGGCHARPHAGAHIIRGHRRLKGRRSTCHIQRRSADGGGRGAQRPAGARGGAVS